MRKLDNTHSGRRANRMLTKLETPTDPQQQGWPAILAGKSVLISAPTGSGKTLAAFLACLDELVRKALAGQLPDETHVLYLSPLKALGTTTGYFVTTNCCYVRHRRLAGKRIG